MGLSPYDFIVNHSEKDRLRFQSFKHRTFNLDDSLAFLTVLQDYYRENSSLERLFGQGIVQGLNTYHELFNDNPWVLRRTLKHIPSPIGGSACKRMNMFLRWMVRKDEAGVDFGIWESIKPAELYIPLDVHVGRVARQYGLLSRMQNDWKAVVELTDSLRHLDPLDPVKYDFALFSLGVNGQSPNQ
jgi:uncharacterized protein (TIGR02757 family)